MERDRRDTPGEAASRRRADESPTLPTRTRDEQDVGWGDEPAARDEEWYRRERPPHHE